MINKGKVLDAVHSLEAQRLLVAQGVYCIRPKCKAKAEKESPKFKFSSKCPDFIEKKTDRKIELLWGPIDYQKFNKTKKLYWHKVFQKEITSSSQVIRPLIFWKTDKKLWLKTTSDKTLPSTGRSPNVQQNLNNIFIHVRIFL